LKSSPAGFDGVVADIETLAVGINEILDRPTDQDIGAPARA
jgi:hypothetical protein